MVQKFVTLSQLVKRKAFDMQSFLAFMLVIKINSLHVVQNTTTEEINSKKEAKRPTLYYADQSYLIDLNATKVTNETNNRVKHFHFNLLSDTLVNDQTTETNTKDNQSGEALNLIGIWKGKNHLDILKTNYLAAHSPTRKIYNTSATTEMEDYIITWKPMPVLKHKEKVVTKIQVKIKNSSKTHQQNQSKIIFIPHINKAKEPLIKGTKTEHVKLGNVGLLTMWGDVNPSLINYNQDNNLNLLETWRHQYTTTASQDLGYRKSFVGFRDDKAQSETDTKKSSTAQFNDVSDEINEKDKYKHGANKEIRVICLVPTHPANHYSRAIHVKNTWSKRCHRLLFISTERDSNLSTVVVPVQEGWNYLWGKTKAAFKYAYNHYFDEGDWFLKADDDTYIIMENLKRILSQYKSEEPLYLGCKLRSFFEYDFGKLKYVKPDSLTYSERMESEYATTEQSNAKSVDYMSGSAYILSKDALRRLVHRGMTDPNLCVQGDHGAEDILMAKCMKKIKVRAVDLSNSQNHKTFPDALPNTAYTYSPLYRQMWYFKRLHYPQKRGLECCSDYAITFTSMYPDDMYLADYLIHRGKPENDLTLDNDDVEKIRQVELKHKKVPKIVELINNELFDKYK